MRWIAFISVILATIATALASVPAKAFQFRKIVDTSTPIRDGSGAFFNFNNSDVPAVGGDWVVFDTGDMTIWRERQKVSFDIAIMAGP